MTNTTKTGTMATANCRNEDCDKEPWELRKHPSQYARGGPSCPDCGSSRVDVEADQRAQEPAQAPAPAQQPQQAQQPAPAQQQQPQGGLPTTEEAMAGGMQVGNLLAGLQSDDPRQKATASGKMLKMAGSAVAQLGDHYETQAVESNERARRASGDDIRVSQDYPPCPECGTLLKNIPDGEFDCPSCGTPLEYTA